MNMRRKRVAVAMSGGIDSSVTALLLIQKGFDVIGITGRMINSNSADTVCENAKEVCKKLGIKHYEIDVTKKFKQNVIDYFENSYAKGETPNPCIMCNQFIKWGDIFNYSINTLEADVFATGHYANIKYDNGFFKLYPAKDEHKDQLYFLYRLNQKELSRTLFPLHEYKKSEVKEIAEKYDLPSKSSKESQDICFIEKPNTTKKYLINKFGTKKGDFIEINTGKKLGEHSGSYQYTIGQRKGIGIAASYPLYVIEIDSEKNIVYLGKNEDNLKTKLSINNLNLSYPQKNNEFDALVKIRYNMKAQKARVLIKEDNTANIIFYEPVSSVTKGQAGVFYDIYNGHLIGGGIVL